MKKLIILAFACAALSAVNADVLYWMVSDAEVEKVGTTSDKFDDTTFATLYAVDGSGEYAVSTKTGTQVFNAYDGYDTFAYTMGDPLTAPYNTYSFFVELANGTRSDTQTYAALLNSGYISAGSMSNPTSIAAIGFGQSSTYNVPEPTSGLLFLVGGMLLGLKRRRQQV